MANLLYANDFNGYIFNDHIQSNVDSEGRVFVGNLAQYTNYGVGSTLTLSLTRDDLIVSNEIDITGGVNQNGNTTIGTAGIVTTYTMANANGVPDQPLVKDYPELTTSKDLYICMSNFYNALASTGTAEVLFGQLVLTGTDNNLNIFDIDAADVAGSGFSLDTLNGINLVVPDLSTVIVNVHGTAPVFGGYSMFKNNIAATGEDGQYWLWNFSEATTLFIGTLSVKGSILAPNASTDSTFGNIEGTLITTDLTGNVELHNFPFIGNLPETDCQVEPICTAYCDIVASIALEEEAIAAILLAESKKLEFLIENATVADDLMKANDSVKSIVKKLTMLELILKQKLKITIDKGEC